MAEWGILILIVAVAGTAYWFSRQFNDTKEVVATWIVAGVIIAIGLGIYSKRKLSTFEKNWSKVYDLDEGRRR